MSNTWEAVQQAAERKRLAEQELQAAQLAYHDACGEYERILAASHVRGELTNNRYGERT